MKKILLIRFSSIGDIVLTTPVVRVLKEQIGCELHVLTKKAYEGIYLNNPRVDVVHSLQNNSNELITALRGESFDFVVDLQKNLRSRSIVRKLRKPWASFPKLNIDKWLLVNFKLQRMPDKHLVDRYFMAIDSLGATNDGKGLEYHYSEEEIITPSSLGKLPDKGFAAWAIGGQHFTKIMPPEKVASIISGINIPVVLLGGPDDRERGDKIVQLVTSNKPVNACGRLSLDGSASIIDQASLVLSNDTGLMHIAAALGKPTISLWGNTVPQFGMYPYMPEMEDKFVIAEVKGLSCRPCSKLGHKKCPKGHFRCMMDQDEDFILNSAEKLIGRGQPSQ